MATVFSHPAIPVGIALALGRKAIPQPLLVAGMISTVIADIDCLGFAFGVPYESQWGHRGFTHSIAFALAIAIYWTWKHKSLEAKRWVAFAFTFVSAMSHPLIDALTDGGLGIAFFWPFSGERYFFPVTPIPVSPIGGGFFSAEGLRVFLSELTQLWLPALSLGGAGWALRRTISAKKAATK